MNPAAMAAKARADARAKYALDQRSEDPIAALTKSLREETPRVRPHWLQEDKKRDSGESFWGPAATIHGGDAADRNNAFSAGLRMTFGGV
jgi:hypothetical protein